LAWAAEGNHQQVIVRLLDAGSIVDKAIQSATTKEAVRVLKNCKPKTPAFRDEGAETTESLYF
jgi:hypothetical protein